MEFMTVLVFRVSPIEMMTFSGLFHSIHISVLQFFSVSAMSMSLVLVLSGGVGGVG